MDLREVKEAHNQPGNERLATSEEMAEFGSGPADPLTEAEILALLEAQIQRDLDLAAAQSLELQKQAAREEIATGSTTEPAAPWERPTLPARPPVIPESLQQQVSKSEEIMGPIEPDFSEPERVAAAFFGEEELARPEEVAQADVASIADSLEPVTAFQQQDLPMDRAASPAQPEAAAPAMSAEPQPTLEATDDSPGPEVTTDSMGPARVPYKGPLEFAEAIDQHRLWTESGGKNGQLGDLSDADLPGADLTAVNLQGANLAKANLRGADLSMANLRGANLVEADLRETNLLGTEFSGANLMGANLYGAQGLWAGRLGGTNLFDAALPESIASFEGSKTIGQFTQSARRFYLIVMTLCAIACALIALTTDVRLLLDESATVTARIPNFLPLQGFFLGAPLLLTVLYMRLQFLLLRLWGSMGALPAVFPDGQTPEKDGSWYLMGPIRQHMKWLRDPRSPLAIVESTLAKLLAYWAVPATLLLFWVRYLVMQDYRGTLLQVFLFVLVGAAACAMPRLVARVLRPGEWTDESTSSFLKHVLSGARIPVYVGAVLFLLSLGVIKGLPADANVRPDVGRGDPRRWASTAFQALGYRPYADISEEAVGQSVNPSPAGPSANDAEAGSGNGPRLNQINLRYSRGYRSQFAGARMWRANLEGASLAEADFRDANLREAILRAANLDHLRAEKVSMVSGDARNAVFAGADFRQADLSYANLDGATLTTANFARATLYSVQLRGANLLRADLSHADLRDVKLQDSVLSLALLEQTDLSAAKLTGANLTGAQAKGTIFLEADLSKADLRGASFPGAVLRQTTVEGARVEGADFRGALGLEAWQVCSMQGWRAAQFDADVKQAADAACGSLPTQQQ